MCNDGAQTVLISLMVSVIVLAAVEPKKEQEAQKFLVRVSLCFGANRLLTCSVCCSKKNGDIPDTNGDTKRKPRDLDADSADVRIRICTTCIRHEIHRS